MKRTGWVLLLAVSAVLVLAPWSVAGTEQARAYLVLASNEQAQPDPALRDFDTPLRQVFGYKSYRLLASDAAELKGNTPVALRLDRGISVHVTPLGVERNVRHLDVRIKQGPTTLLMSKMRMTGGAPLFIRAHELGDGLLVIVLEVR